MYFMKRFIPWLFLVALLPLSNPIKAQCTIKNVIVQVNSSVPVGTGSCELNFDFIFTIENNGGNKWIYMHAWMMGDPAYFTCTANGGFSPSKAPLSADLALSKINIGIHNESHPQHGGPYLLQQYSEPYPADPTVVLTPADSLVRRVYPTGDSARFIIKGIKVTLPSACSSVITMKADFWSSQAQNGDVVHCANCEVQFTIDPRIAGFINCTNPRTYNVAISSVAPMAISGTFRTYLDYPSDPLNPFGSLRTFGPEDIEIAAHPYVTTGGAVNQFVQTGITYAPYSTQQPEAGMNLWVLVQTNGYTNQALGYLANSCSPLPLKFSDFNVAINNGLATLTWITEMESNVNRFEVERKLDNSQFVKTGAVTHAGGELDVRHGSYTYTDQLATKDAVVYYRIKVVDNDGQITYSDVKMIRQANKLMNILVYPNPGKDVINVVMPETNGVVNVVLDDFSGKTIKRWTGMKAGNMQLTNLLPGVYILRVNVVATGEQAVAKIVVQ